MLDRLRGMEVFAATAALGGLSAAARKLDMSQTMATKHLAALETRLGVKLFYRTTRRLSLTEAGQDYLDAVERILGDVADADAKAASGAIDVRGTLRLNAPISFGVREIAPLLPEFARVHPALAIDFSLSDHFVDLVEEGWDLAIRIGDIQNSSLTVRRLGSLPSVVCAAPSYLEAHGIPQTVADLASPQLPQLHAAARGQPLAVRQRSQHGDGSAWQSARQQCGSAHRSGCWWPGDYVPT